MRWNEKCSLLEEVMKRIIRVIIVCSIMLVGCSSNSEDYSSLITKNKDIEKQLTDMSKSFSVMQEEYKNLKEKVDQQNALTEENNRTISQLYSEITKLNKSNEDLVQKNEDLTNQIVTVKNNFNTFVGNFPTEEERNYILTKENIERLVHLNKQDVIDLLGYDYTYDYYRDGAYAYFYSKYTVIFDDYNRLDGIDCSSFMFEKKEIKTGMTFHELKKIFGETNIEEIDKLEPYDPTYVISYECEGYCLWFGAHDKEEGITDIQIRIRP